MDRNSTPNRFIIERLSDGGYVVLRDHNFGRAQEPVFAAGKIDKALAYIRDNLAKPAPEERAISLTKSQGAA